MKNLKISIITVVKNNKDTIEKNILSLLNQNYKNYEHIIIDGGSKDGTIEIINKYKKHIKYFISEKDNGIYDAMNKGIDRVEGDIIGILDALCDITYVSLGNGTLLHGLKGKIWKAYQEVQASNMSKSCATLEEAEETVKVRSEEKGHPCHYEKIGDRYVVYRSSDRKVMKSINYFAPNLKQFFTDEELRKTTRS